MTPQQLRAEVRDVAHGQPQASPLSHGSRARHRRHDHRVQPRPSAAERGRKRSPAHTTGLSVILTGSAGAPPSGLDHRAPPVNPCEQLLPRLLVRPSSPPVYAAMPASSPNDQASTSQLGSAWAAPRAIVVPTEPAGERFRVPLSDTGNALARPRASARAWRHPCSRSVEATPIGRGHPRGENSRPRGSAGNPHTRLILKKASPAKIWEPWKMSTFAHSGVALVLGLLNWFFFDEELLGNAEKVRILVISAGFLLRPSIAAISAFGVALK
jgi:hypothetical protein